jgi:hypothetical protein
MFFKPKQKSIKESFVIDPEFARLIDDLDFKKLGKLATRLDYEFQLAKLSPLEIGYMLFQLAFTCGYRCDLFAKERKPSYRGNQFIDVIYPTFCKCFLAYKSKMLRSFSFTRLRVVKGGTEQKN